MFRTLLSRSVVSSAAVALVALALSSGSAFACKNNPFNSAQADDSNLPLIASNESGKCGGNMSKESKPGEAMQCGDGKCGGNMSTDGKPSGDAKKCEGSMTKDGKPAGEAMQCGAGKCGSK